IPNASSCNSLRQQISGWFPPMVRSGEGLRAVDRIVLDGERGTRRPRQRIGGVQRTRSLVRQRAPCHWTSERLISNERGTRAPPLGHPAHSSAKAGGDHSLLEKPRRPEDVYGRARRGSRDTAKATLLELQAPALQHAQPPQSRPAEPSTHGGFFFRPPSSRAVGGKQMRFSKEPTESPTRARTAR